MITQMMTFSGGTSWQPCSTHWGRSLPSLLALFSTVMKDADAADVDRANLTTVSFSWASEMA